MILSVSRRTDIPAYYADWFFARLQAGFVLVRNPMNPRSVARIPLSPDTVDGIVLWTKNPLPMLQRLPLLDPYPYYVQMTLTPYGEDVEANLPPKDTVLLPALLRLSETLGPERVIWRYDPILLSARYTVAYHMDAFARMAKRLAGYTRHCTISFLDGYRNTEKNMAHLQPRPIEMADMALLSAGIARLAAENGMVVTACAEAVDLSAYGVVPAACVDAARMSRISGRPLAIAKDKNQRAACGCAASIDIGAYNTCRNGCVYCYANYAAQAIPRNAAQHDPRSPLLIGRPGPEDRIYDRRL